jgi:CheY-like chemotaxis protein
MPLTRALLLTAQRPYAHAMRQALVGIAEPGARLDVELDPLRAMEVKPQLYEIILLDARIDSLDGIQLLRLMKQQAPATKFILVSDASDETSRVQAYQNGADFFLRRPTTPEAISAALENIRALIPARMVLEEETEPRRPLLDLVKSRCAAGDSTLLLVQGSAESGDIFIHHGEVHHAQFPGRGGEAAFFEMAHWDDGMVRIKEMKLHHPPPRTIEAPIADLLARVGSAAALAPQMELPGRQNPAVAGTTPEAVREAPPLSAEQAASAFPAVTPAGTGETQLPALNAHWKVNLMGELTEGSQVADVERCSFITYFIYRKLADVAVTLEVDYFSQVTLFGPHLQQVLVADNLGVRHGVFDAAWTTEPKRLQFIQWCHEQSF